MSPKKWIEFTNAMGIVSKSGRYGGTYAHSDIAFEFASWILPELTAAQISYTYASEADMLNVGMKLLHELAVQQVTTMSTLDLKKLPGIEVIFNSTEFGGIKVIHSENKKRNE